MSDQTANPSRRALLTGATAAALAGRPALAVAIAPQSGALAIPSAALNLDAELIDLAQKAYSMDRRMFSLVAPFFESSSEMPQDQEEEVVGLVADLKEIAEVVANTPATTIQGLAAKVRVMLCFAQRDTDGELYWENHNDLIGWSLARDLIGDQGDVREITWRGMPA